MAVKRIVPNIAPDAIEPARAFYRDVLDMKVVMDQGWIVTFAAEAGTVPQISIATQGGSGAPVPDCSIEVDNLDEVYERALAGGFPIEYGPVDEPWGVRRFYVRDPFGRLLNILARHCGQATRSGGPAPRRASPSWSARAAPRPNLETAYLHLKAYEARRER
jgi:catechol 2,3-dioxygenase-like lactoylglutathione lyase family enzyme